MFTGLVTNVGYVERFERGDGGARIEVACSLGELEGGESVAVSGICLTVAAASDGRFEADVMNQTLGVSTLGRLEPGAGVNLERALRASDRLGGHIVQGHVDGVGEVIGSRNDGIARRVEVGLPAALRPLTVERGSIAIDGVSLTVASLTDRGIEVSLVPETLERTTLGGLAEGSRVNVEVDVLARYAQRLLQGFNERKSG
jgi:riboflavin synthase